VKFTFFGVLVVPITCVGKVSFCVERCTNVSEATFAITASSDPWGESWNATGVVGYPKPALPTKYALLAESTTMRRKLLLR